MISLQNIKQRLLLELEQLTREQMLETLSFMKQLKDKQNKEKVVAVKVRRPEDDPILQVIGLADTAPFAEDI